ncbi:MAG: family 10 glycosylhydrolase [Bacteroidota bacterium]
MKVFKTLVFSSILFGVLGPLLTPPNEKPAPAPNRELRGAWMATVLNIDYPQRPTVDPAVLQADFRSQLHRLQAIGMNAVFVQVRAASDAIYPSQYAPWSQWLTGRQGVAPGSEFDPLAFMIDEAHSHGMEFHAWLNPYRVSMNLDSTGFAADNVFYEHRDWVRKYGDRWYLDPGLPQVQSFLLTAVGELVDNYDIDGIHFDDYFYPYPLPGEFFPDSLTYQQYGRAYVSLEEWRRDNVNSMVRQVSRLIKSKKPYVKFGISPFGVWRNQDRDPRGSATRAFATSYDDLYGDALAWATEGTIDYLAPQLYWNIGFDAADYAVLLDWWTTYTNIESKIYIGHAAYKVGDNPEPAWNDLEELPRQINLNRQNPRISGSLFFSTKSLLNSSVELDQRLRDVFSELRMVPEHPGATSPLPLAPKMGKVKKTAKGTRIVWELEDAVPDDELPYYYAIYRSLPNETAKLIHITPFSQGCRRYHFYDKNTAAAEKPAIYEVRAVDRWHRESIPSNDIVP